MKIDILKNELYITAFRRVLKNYVPHKKIIHTEGRAWDALIFVLGGSCCYRFDDGIEFTAQAGDLFYLAKGSIYEMDVSAERYEVIFIDFLFGGDEMRKSALLSSQNADRERVFRRIHHIYEAKDGGYLSRCLSEIYRLYADLIAAESSPYLPTVMQKKTEAARDFLLQNLSDPDLRQEAIAAGIGVSEVYLRRVFRRVFGVSPAVYMRNRRIEYAKELLCTEEYSVTDVAMLSGFNDTAYFAREFKKVVGVTPSAYREDSPKTVGAFPDGVRGR